MIGQGRPTSVRTLAVTGLRYVVRMIVVSLWIVALSRSAGAEGLRPETLRLRIEWGGGTARAWHGNVSLSEGTLSDHRGLGIESDSPGSVWFEQGKLWFLQRSVRGYDGIDVTVQAPLSARLIVELETPDLADALPPIEIPLEQLLENAHSATLDESQNRLMIRRVPGDMLRLETSRTSLVFSPGETFDFKLLPTLIPAEAGTRTVISSQLIRHDTSDVISSKDVSWRVPTAAELDAPPPVGIDQQVILPVEEGVYDLVIEVEAPRLPTAVIRKRTFAQRTVQLVVVDTQPRGMPEAFASEEKLVAEIDPANPRWWQRITTSISRLSRLNRGPWSNTTLQPLEQGSTRFMQLPPQGSLAGEDIPWIAYPLEISRVGIPHVVEVEYSGDAEQILGISLVEANSASRVMPPALDSGVFVAAPSSETSDPTVTRIHRLICWPKSKSPTLLITNRGQDKSATFGRIRVWELPGGLSTSNPTPLGHEGRLLAAYMDRPLLGENFSAPDRYDEWSRRSLHDWSTFHLGATRLVEYLKYAGANGIMMSAVADGSAIYPSTLLESTPRYDSGIYSSQGHDPQRKDVLELLFRIFDREGLTFIPTIHFSAPLPELEALVRTARPQSEGLEWVDGQGLTWLQQNTPRDALAPYYNPLNPNVQRAMAQVVQELVQRYGHHASFGGVGVRLAADGYAQLLGPEWGMDDQTTGRFASQAEFDLPVSGADRFARRAELLTGPYRKAWLAWRAESMTDFYRQLHELVDAAHPGAKVYLAGTEVFASTELTEELRPSLPRKSSPVGLLQRVGIDPVKIGESSGLVLLRPRQIVPPIISAENVAKLVVNEDPELDRLLGGSAWPGYMCYHAPQMARLQSFDQQGPFRSSYTWLVAQMVPSGAQARERFIHALSVMDARAMFDGGWLVPLDPRTMRNLAAVYRQLPDEPFEELQLGVEPVKIRTYHSDEETYTYLVNDSPWTVRLELELMSPTGCEMQEIASPRPEGQVQRDGKFVRWNLEMQPYDLRAARFTQADVRIVNGRATLPEGVVEQLRHEIRELESRAISLQNQPPLDVVNNWGFEAASASGSPIQDWVVNQQEGVNAALDLRPHGGKQCVRLTSTGPVVSLASEPFDPPDSGRLSVMVWLKVADQKKQPPLRMAIEGVHRGEPYYRHASLGAGQVARDIETEWSQFEFLVDELPLSDLQNLRVRFDLMGEGDVWIDDVQLHAYRFGHNELVALSRVIELAEGKLDAGQFGQCHRMLQGFWPQYLVEHIRLPESDPEQRPGVANQTPPSVPSTDAKPREESPGLMGRLRKMLPGFMRF